MPATDQNVWNSQESQADGYLDPAEIAHGVRQIALDLHQALKKPNLSFGELLELQRRIDQMRRHTAGTQLTALDRWLDQSRAVIQTRTRAALTPQVSEYPRQQVCLQQVVGC
jgi:hypothetical protein